MSKTPKLTASITVKFTAEEAEDLKARASSAGMPLRTYIRRQMTSESNVSGETTLILANQERTRELVTRIAAGYMNPAGLQAIISRVDAIGTEVLVRRALGEKQGKKP